MVAKALRLAAWWAVISLVVTALRFYSERAGLPGTLSFLLGITWVALLAGLYYGFKLATEARPYAWLLLGMYFLGWLSRIPVVALWWITRTYGLDTHYAVFQSWGQAINLELLLGPLEHLAIGGIPGVILLALKRRKTLVSA